MSRPRVVIIGGGILGLTTADHLIRNHPRVRVVVLEKEPAVAQHQSGRNSGVLHSGIYYRPGSLKSELCRRGKDMMQRFCDDHGVTTSLCGKLIVATGEHERAALTTLQSRAQLNHVRCDRIGGERLHELEPHVAGLEALHIPEAGVVDYHEVCEALRRSLNERGVDIRCGQRVVAVRPKEVISEDNHIRHDVMINCAGLQSDRVARLAGQRPGVTIVPFRGEYFELMAPHLCRSLIYPVPDPQLPFLGVHMTRRVDGRVDCGPNAVLSLGRESYRAMGDAPWGDIGSLVKTRVVRLALEHWRTAGAELWRSWSQTAFLRSVQRLVPAVRASDLSAAPCGIRAQAVGPRGELVDDFVIEETPWAVHVLNAPSPGATASFAIAERIAQRALQKV